MPPRHNRDSDAHGGCDDIEQQWNDATCKREVYGTNELAKPTAVRAAADSNQLLGLVEEAHYAAEAPAAANAFH